MKTIECLIRSKDECCLVKLLCQWCMYMCACTKNALFTLGKNYKFKVQDCPIAFSD